MDDCRGGIYPARVFLDMTSSISGELAGGIYVAPTGSDVFAFAMQTYNQTNGTGMPVPYELSNWS